MSTLPRGILGTVGLVLAASACTMAIGSPVDLPAVIEVPGIPPSFDAAYSSATLVFENGAPRGRVEVEIVSNADGPIETSVELALDPDTAPEAPTAVYDRDIDGLTIYVNEARPTSFASIVAATDSLDDFVATAQVPDDRGFYDPLIDTPPAATSLSGGRRAGGGISQRVLLELETPQSRVAGSHQFFFAQGATIDELVAYFNYQSEETRVEAFAREDTLVLQTLDTGSSAYIGLSVIIEEGGADEPRTFSDAIRGYLYDVGEDAAVPEPGAGVLACGLLALGGAARRRV